MIRRMKKEPRRIIKEAKLKRTNEGRKGGVKKGCRRAEGEMMTNDLRKE